MTGRVATALRIAAAAGGALIAGGAFGPWGALSTVPEQRYIHDGTIPIVIVLAVAAVAAATVGIRPKLALLSVALVAFAFAGFLIWSYIGYEEMQTFHYSQKGAPRWGFQVGIAGSLLGMASCLDQLTLEIRKANQARQAEP